MILNFKHFVFENLKDNKFLKGDEFVYHFTSWKGLLNILESNTLKSFEGSERDLSKVDIQNNNKSFICLTRNKSLGYNYIKITLDKNKLLNKYKIIPFDWSNEFTKQNFSEAEERIYKDVKDIKKYIVEIELPYYLECEFKSYHEYNLQSFREKVDELIQNTNIITTDYSLK